MSAQIKPNRLEVNDRFPMLGFNIRADQPDIEAEVALATDVALFKPENKPQRTAANFYSSRESGRLAVPRGEGVFVVPPDVLARFIGRDRLFFGLASGRSTNGGLHVDALPRDGSPYVSLRGLTGRTLRRTSLGAKRAGMPMFEWAGDMAKPGAEPATPTNGDGATPQTNGAPPPMATNGDSQALAYDDGFGAMPTRARKAPAANALAYSRGLDAASWSPDRILAWLQSTASTIAVSLASDVSPPTVVEIDSSWLKTAARTAFRTYAMTLGPLGPVIAAAPELARQAGVTIAIGPVANSPFGGGGFGIAFGPDESIAVYGNVDFDLDLAGIADIMKRLELGIGARFAYLAGGVASLRSIAKVASAAFGEEVVVGAEALFDASNNYLGAAVRIEAGVAFEFAAEDVRQQVVTPRMPGDQRARADRIGGQFAGRIGEALDLGLKPESIDPLLDTLDPPAMPQPMSHQPKLRAKAMGAPTWSIQWDNVDLVAQPTDNGCWATTLAMLMGWRDEVCYDPGSIAQQCGKDIANGLPWSERQAAADALGLGTVPPQCYLPEGFSALLENHGPLYVGKMASSTNLSGHAVLVVGMYSDGTDHFLRVVDPWDRPVGVPGTPGNYLPTHNSGSRYIMKYEDFQREYEMAADGNPSYVQIIYAGVPAGRSINRSTTPPAGFAMAYAPAPSRAQSAEDDVLSPPPPAPRARAMSGAEAAIAIGGFLLETVRDSSGDVTWELDQFANRKHPNDVAPANPAPYRDAPTIKLDTWPVTGGMVDDISAWFSVDWQYNGTSLGNVRISNIGTNDAVGWSLHVRAQIMDNNILYEPGPCAALRIRFHYRFSRGIGSDKIAVTDINLYGDGTHDINSHWVQAEMLGVTGPTPPARRKHARAFAGGLAGELLKETIKGGEDSVKWTLEQFKSVKHPNDVAPTPVPPFQWAPTIKIRDWERGMIMDCGADFDVKFQFNGQSVGNVEITNVGFDDSFAWNLNVMATITADNGVYDNRAAGPVMVDGNLRPLMRNDDDVATPDMARKPCAALRVRIEFNFTQWPVGGAHKGIVDLVLFGDGTHARWGRWVQEDFF